MSTNLISRRGTLAAGAAALASLAFPRAWPARADEAAPDDPTGYLLDNASWIADGSVSDRQIYVIAAPWCVVCQSFYKQTRALTKKIQFRWIMAGTLDDRSAAQNAEAAFTRSKSLLHQFYHVAGGPSTVPPTARLVADWNDGVNTSISRIVAARGGQTGFPILCWKSASGHWEFYAGIPDIQTVVSQVVTRPEARDVSPQAIDLLSKIRTDQQIAPVNMYARDAGLKVYAAPDVNAPVIDVLGKSDGYKKGVTQIVTTTDGEQWAGFSLARARGPDVSFWTRLSDLQNS